MTTRSLLLASLAFVTLTVPAAAAFTPQPVPPTGNRVSILDESTPAAIAILDLATGSFVPADGARKGQRIVLPVPRGERARAQAVFSSAKVSHLWVATDSRLVRIDANTAQTETTFPLPAEAFRATVDLFAFADAGREKVIVAISPAEPEELSPGLFVLDGASGEVLARYTAVGDEMDLVFALVRDELSGRFVLSNRRLTPGGIKTTMLTGLAWDGTGFSETAEMTLPSPMGLTARAALTSVAPGLAVAATLDIPTATVIDSSVPAAFGEHPYLELDPGIQPIALGGSASLTDPWGRPDLFLLDSDGHELLRTRGFDGQVTAGRSLGDLGLAATPGSALVVAPAQGAVVVSSPSTGGVAILEIATLAPRSVPTSPLARPGSMLQLP